MLKRMIKKFETDHPGLKILDVKKVSKNSFRGKLNIYPYTVSINSGGVYMHGTKMN